MSCSQRQLVVSGAGLDLGYRGVPLLQDVTFEVGRGDILAVLGHNGSGKSTLVKTLLGIIPSLAGDLTWHLGKPDPIGYLGQLTEFDRRFPIRVKDLAEMGAWRGMGFAVSRSTEQRRKAEDAMVRCGIEHIADMPLHELSAGQLQRALFARTLVQDASLILLDEPFTAVDQTTEDKLLGIIDSWAAEGRAVILVVHDLTAVLQHCNRALLLGKSRTRFGFPRSVLTPENLVDQGYMSSGQADWILGMGEHANDPDSEKEISIRV